MIVQDVLGVMYTQAAARDRGWLLGVLDAVTWIFAIATINISVTALQGHDTGLKVAVIVLVTAANFFGSKLGQVIGTRFIKPIPDPLVKILLDKKIITLSDWAATQPQKNRHIKALLEREAS